MEAEYGASFRVRLGVACEGDEDTLGAAVSIPEPPGLDLLDHLARVAR